MEKGFELLEQKVRKAAELVKRLQGENKALATQLAEAQARLKQAARDLEVPSLSDVFCAHDRRPRRSRTRHDPHP